MKRVHFLSEIDPAERTAQCENCGPVSIKSAGLGRKGQARWKCGVAATLHKKNPRGYRRHLKDYCEKCNFIAVDPCQLDVHHIDGDHRNNDPVNLQTLCANCHRLESKQEQISP